MLAYSHTCLLPLLKRPSLYLRGRFDYSEELDLAYADGHVYGDANVYGSADRDGWVGVFIEILRRVSIRTKTPIPGMRLPLQVQVWMKRPVEKEKRDLLFRRRCGCGIGKAFCGGL